MDGDSPRILLPLSALFRIMDMAMDLDTLDLDQICQCLHHL